MDRNFARALAVTLQYEGGWSDNPKDPGGATMKGVTLATFRRRVPNASKADLRAISDQNLAVIYRDDFWNAVKADALGDGVDLATFDAAVNSGPGRANGWLKASLGGSNVETVKRICAKRLGFMQSLKIWKTFGGGWSRRVAAIEAKGVAWAVAATSPATVVKSTLQNEQKAATAKSKTAATTAGTATAAGGGDAVVNPHHVASMPGWVLGLLILAGAAVIAALVIRSIVNKHRAEAYAAEAASQGVPQ